MSVTFNGGGINKNHLLKRLELINYSCFTFSKIKTKRKTTEDEYSNVN